MSDETIAIRAELISDIPEQAARSGAALKEMGATAREGFASATESTSTFSKAIDSVHASASLAAGGGVSTLTRKTSEMGEAFKRSRESVASLGDSITERLIYPMRQLSYAVEAATAGMATFGLTTFSSLQQAGLQLSMFTGSSAVGGQALKSLMALRDPASLGALSGSYETLVNGGSSNGQALALTRALAGAGAVSGNSDAVIGSAASALANITTMGGKITNSDVTGLLSAFPQIYQILAGDQGTTASALRTSLGYGATIQLPADLFAQLESTRQAIGGQSAYQQTFAGRVAAMKTSVGDALATIETPLAGALGHMSSDISTWANQTEGRFKALSGTLGQEWSAGNVGGFSSTLAQALGDPKLASGIDTTIHLGDSLAKVLTGGVIPAVEGVAKIVTPFVEFLGNHESLTATLVGTLGGLVVLEKVGSWGEAAYKGLVPLYKLLTGIGKAIGVIDGTKAVGAGESLLSKALGGGATEAASTGILDGGVSLLGGEALAGLGGPLGITAGLGAYGIYKMFQNDQNVNYFKDGSVNDLTSAQIAAAGQYQGLGGAASGALMVGTMNVTIPGAGNPEKVANSMPKNINRQVRAYNGQVNRRSGQQ